MTQLDNDFLADLDRPRGGRWVKKDDFSAKGDKISGLLREIDIRDRTDPEGNVVLGRKSGKARKIYRVTFEVPAVERDGAEDDGIRIWDANEAGQTAVRDAVKKAGTKELIGGQFRARVKAEAPDSFSQATYEVEFTPPAKTVELPDTDGDDW